MFQPLIPNTLLIWYMENRAFTGENIYQCDHDFQEIITRIAEKGFKFKLEAMTEEELDSILLTTNIVSV